MDYQEQAPAGPQGVGVGRRFVAILIVGIIEAIINLLLPNQLALSSSIGFVIYIVYFIVLEATLSSTPGKLALGLRVVNQSGAPISWSESIVRNLMRIIDLLFVYLVAAISVWTSPTNQRLGDRVAHTYVVKK